MLKRIKQTRSEQIESRQIENRQIENKRSRGFTLIEILLVVVILGILGAVVVPQIIGRDDTARVQAAKTDIQRIGQALNMYRLDNFQYPSDEQGLEALVSEPSGFPEPKNYNPDGYLPKIPVDPWGTPYVYERVDSKFRVYSLGADAQEGGEGLNQDIRGDNS